MSDEETAAAGAPTVGDERARPDLTARDAKLMAFLDAEPAFDSVKPLVEPPLEITRSMLSLLNMRDETVIVYEPGRNAWSSMPQQRGQKGGSPL